jgi:tetratricopeptide (TPR) repeat protein
MRHLKVVGLLAAMALVLSPTTGHAQGTSPKIGTRVVLKSRDTPLKVGKQVVATDDIHRVYTIERVNGPWLWVSASGVTGRVTSAASGGVGVSGWVQASEVVPFDQAIDHFTRVIQSRPSSWAFNMRGMIWADKREFDSALGDYNEAIRRDPKNAGAYANRGTVWFETGQLDLALADYHEAIRLDPGDAALYANRGNLWYAKKDLHQAMADYDEALRRDPLSVGAHTGRGRVWRAKKEYDKALADFDEALRLDPCYVAAHHSRAVTRLLASRDGVSEAARSYLDLDGWRTPFATYVALYIHLDHRLAQRDDEARRLLDEAMTRCDTKKWPYPILRYLRKEIDAQALLAAASDDAERTEAQTYLGLDLVNSGHPNQAIPYLRWVREHGNRNLIEYEIALTTLDRIDRKKISSLRP